MTGRPLQKMECYGNSEAATPLEVPEAPEQELWAFRAWVGKLESWVPVWGWDLDARRPLPRLFQAFKAGSSRSPNKLADRGVFGLRSG